MLDNETKRKIDTARNILVGKVPDPKSQVEQITIALIYKFMNDMDAVAEELGGSRTFFSEKFERYSWNNLMAPGMGGYDVLNLYAEAIQKMDFNPNIPTLFRDIFKNAFLPYRDPQTLKMFLKVINDFSYDHSEKLGDAFEYLLSVLGSQGDAGQFRTPRHIIDFMVEVVNPQKNDTILDPACGTAGFLISAYKHIIKSNTKKGQNGNNLTPDERTTLAENIRGYDISPDMVRLSLVNLYLHGFQTPNIFEYDTLTSQDRWNEYADVILANPPFMSPKGGIRPHKRFSVQSKRSEVLFVDYMCEHLTPNGQSGIIVPEGIIFQSSNAYKQLREMLVKNYLYAVVSLPAGVFQPYSGVKTSILLIDKKLAKRTDKILFVKIENDGFGLGAQRRPIEKNDLPEAIELIVNYKLNHEIHEKHENFAHAVEKDKISESGDWNLSGERYVEYYNPANASFPFIKLDDLFVSIKNGKNVKQIDTEGKYRVTRIQTIADGTVDLSKTKWTNDEVKYENFMEIGDILLSHINSEKHLAKSAIFVENEKVIHGINLIRFSPNKSKVNPYYVASIFKSELFIKKAQSFAQRAVNQASIKIANLKTIKIPLPPLDIQKEIVTEIEGFQKIIDGAKAVVENYKPQIQIDPEWEMVELGEVAKILNGFAFKSSEYCKDGIQIVKIGNVQLDQLNLGKNISFYPESFKDSLSKYILKNEDLLISMTGTQGKRDFGNVCKVNSDKLLFLNQRVGKIKIVSSMVNNHYLYQILMTEEFRNNIFKNASGVRQGNISKNQLECFFIPLPPLEIQKEIVDRIEKEQELVNANKELITIFEQKIKERIARVWGE